MALTQKPLSAETLVGYLAQHDTFCRFPQEVLFRLAGQAVCHTFTPQALIFAEGEPARGLWIVGSGRVKIFKLSLDGGEHILHLVGPGGSFNDISALDDGPTPANAAALTETTACMIPYPPLRDAIRSHPDVAELVIHMVAERTRLLVNQVEELALYSVTTRLARFLLAHAEDPAFSGLTRATIAAHLATTPETLSRGLRALEESGAIHADRHTVRILDRARLKTIALL